MDENPDWYDATWCAVDCDGCLGVFATSASGPIPTSFLEALTGGVEEFQKIERLMELIPKTCHGTEHYRVGNPLWCQDLAERGFFSFTWGLNLQDIHPHQYTLLASPAAPLFYRHLEDEALATYFGIVALTSISFRRGNLVDIRALTQCVEA